MRLLATHDLPQTKRESDYRVQRDRLAQALRAVLVGNGKDECDAARATAAREDARKVLVEIFGA